VLFFIYKKKKARDDGVCNWQSVIIKKTTHVLRKA